MLNIITKKLAGIYPDLHYKLLQAGIEEKPEAYIKKTLLAAIYLTIGLFVFFFLLFAKSGNAKIAFISMPIIFILSLFYIIRIPDAIISKKDKEINREIVYAGRFLVIEIQSGVPLSDAFNNLSKNYPKIGKYFKLITDKVSLGTGMEDAMSEVIEVTPSNNFRRIVWQILNSQRTGADVGDSINSVVEQISREQSILLQEYGRKLNPLAMFYMMAAVIVPSLAVTFFVIISSMMGLEISLTVLLSIVFFMAFVQFMFLSMIKFMRPAVDF